MGEEVWGNPVSSGPMTVWKSSVKEKSKIFGCLCNISVCKPCVRVKGLRFGNAKRKAKSGRLLLRGKLMWYNKKVGLKQRLQCEVMGDSV